MSPERICSVEGCNRFPTIKSYCYMHYSQLVRDEDGLRRQPKMCSIEGCNNRSSVRCYCNKHYYRLLRNGNTELHVASRQAGTCSIEGCDKLSSVRGYCNTHYSQLSRKGVIEISRYAARYMQRWRVQPSVLCKGILQHALSTSAEKHPTLSVGIGDADSGRRNGEESSNEPRKDLLGRRVREAPLC